MPNGEWWNFPFERRTREGILYFPTRTILPAWATPETQAEGERRFELGKARITRITPKFDIAEFRLKISSLFPELPPALDSLALKPLIEREVPVDDVEVVEWMHDSAADNAILTARMDEYNRYSQIAGRAGDGYIPGVRASDISFARMRGYTVAARRGSTLYTPRGSIGVPLGGGNTLIAPDFLSWGGISRTSGIQYMCQGLKWLRLAATPITSSIGFPSYGGIAAPNFFTQRPDEEGSRVRITQVIASNRAQSLPISYRAPSNYTSVVDTGTLSLDPGVSEISYIIASYPSVPTVMLHAAPRNGTQTVLREYRAEVIR